MSVHRLLASCTRTRTRCALRGFSSSSSPSAKDSLLNAFSGAKQSVVDKSILEYVDAMNKALRHIDANVALKTGDAITIQSSMNIGVFQLSTTITRTN